MFGEWICLDLLRSWSGFAQKKYSGWSTSYSAMSIMLQLQSFLCEPEDTSILAIRRVTYEACRYKCATCSHDMTANQPFPYRDGMVKLLTLDEAKKRYEDPNFKTAFQKEKELWQKVGARNAAKYELENKEQIKTKMADQIKQNLAKLQRKMKQEGKEFNVTTVNAGQFIPGMKKVVEQVPQKQPKKKAPSTAYQYSAAEKLYMTKWNTTLDPLAKAYEYKPANAATTTTTTTANVVPTAVPTTTITTSNTPLLVANHSNTFSVKYTAGNLPTEMLLHVFSYLTAPLEIHRVRRVCKQWKLVAANPYLWERHHLICFHTKKSFEEDVIGIGVNLKFNPKIARLEYISTELDLMSYTSFFTIGVRKTSWQDSFTHFVPLFINRDHGKRALKVLEASVCGMHFLLFILLQQLSIHKSFRQNFVSTCTAS